MIEALIKKEIKRQRSVINLIASENYPSEAVLKALGSPLVGKYAEGQVGKRYYNGNEIIDEIEETTKKLALKVFGVSEADYGVNVQPYSGSIANLASYLGALQMGDTILAMSLEHGGHLTHGHGVSLTSKLFHFEHYGVDQDGLIDYDEVLVIAKRCKPKLIVCGATAYSRIIDFARFRAIADEVGALLMADIAHIAGLVAGGVHPSPFPHADIVTMTTHKTLRGPRGAMIISRKSISVGKDPEKLLALPDSIDKAVFPGLQGGPQMHTIAAIGICLEEALKPTFQRYAKQVVLNAKMLAEALIELDYRLITGGTDNHLILIDVSPLGLTGGEAATKLEQAGIIVNKNMVPFDPRKPWDPSGIRIGVQAMTTRGYLPFDMTGLAHKIDKTLRK